MLPSWVSGWCSDHLGSTPVDVLHESVHMSEVFGLRLADGRLVAVKSRASQNGREATCIEVQRFLSAEGFPAAAPLTGVSVEAGRATHAEEWRPGGTLRRGDDPATARLFARLLARLTTLAADIQVGGKEPGAIQPPLPNPEWTRWDHDGPGVWPFPGDRDHLIPVLVADAAQRIRDRLAVVYLPRVLGHADWETQNMRWHGDEPWIVHDWDSLAWLPEAAIAGAASGAFASAEVPTLAPVASSVAFLEEYQRRRGRRFDDNEIEVAWAASLWLALHNARGEAVRGEPAVALAAVQDQAEQRLELAGA
ncbi:phosphotransferase [Actinoplanes sp. TBRC 11911]|uniref:phosphotransferase n=1 Tax=Actinoplanes sp. TBRC 11911 TaxID=2729386 RepID=UPI00145F9407|nr:phosphotransferase [Actinoplanes sp. TBRC 11911]NMO53214.1 phosphotransferase [Actinoplanes sp. TBRC 11911]